MSSELWVDHIPTATATANCQLPTANCQLLLALAEVQKL